MIHPLQNHLHLRKDDVTGEVFFQADWYEEGGDELFDAIQKYADDKDRYDNIMQTIAKEGE